MRLSSRLALAGVVLTVAISLYPFQDWRAVGAGPFDFLWAPLPRVITGFDIASNALAYLPLGALLTLALRAWLLPWPAALLAVLAGSALSLGLEAAQNYLPSRVPSNLDLVANAGGALCGALLAGRWGHLAAPGGVLQAHWRRLREEGGAHEAGLVLLGLWLLAQWSPGTPLFGIGGLRQMLDIDAPGAFSVERFVVFEALASGAGLLAAGLLAASLWRRYRRRFALLALAAGMAIKTLGMVLLAPHGEALAWASPGALRGLIGGGVLLLICAGLRTPWRHAVAACALLLATALNNLIPDNPYLLPAVPGFPAAQWLNFDGLSRLASALWPFLTLSWLIGARTSK